MKRVAMTLAGAAVVVAAIGIARAHTGESTPDAQAPSTSTPSPGVDISRPYDPDLAKQQVKEQAEQLRKAKADLKKQVAEASQKQDQDDRQHSAD